MMFNSLQGIPVLLHNNYDLHCSSFILLVVVKALPQTPALDSDSALFLENRSCLGVVCIVKMKSCWKCILISDRFKMVVNVKEL